MATSHSHDSKSDIDEARAEAIRQLTRIEQESAYAGLVGDAGEDVGPRAARQTTEYVAGITRQRRWLDFLLADLYHGNYEAMEPVLRQILRLGAYELLFLQTPPHAAVHESVELAKQLVRPGAAGLTNGVLRALQRQHDRLPQPETGDAVRDLAIRHSHPTWMVRRWYERFGPSDTQALLAWNNSRPTYSVRCNLLKMTPADFFERLEALGVGSEPSLYLDDFVRVRSLQPLLREGLLEEGLCAVQDESAGLIVRLLDPQPGEMVIDGCAAPGGKVLYAAGRMCGHGSLWAVDISQKRLQLLREAARAQGVEVQIRADDLRRFADRSEAPQADRVLVDAPCSGLGVLAKRADLRWQRSPEDLEELITLQDELLDAAAQLVRPSGLLVYATCTIESEENEERVEAFLQRHPEFEQEGAGGFVPTEMITEEGYFASLPHRDAIDGAFGARLRRTS